MRPVWVLLAFLGCGNGGTARPGPVTPTPDTPHGELAGEDLFVPTYGKAELGKALIAERGAEATGERIVAELEAKAVDGPGNDRWRIARMDLEVRRRFIKSLEACESSGHACPPRLDDPTWSYDPDPEVVVAPKVDSELRFDLASWQKLSAELFGRACACRTIACVDSMTVVIDQLEIRPMAEVQGDETASLSVMRARECLFRLRGKTATPGGPAPSIEE
ncbi:MAG: hypothetical protein IPQ07_23880 [Myxococcales bacterium]|nr:hypothetical protein [Myxococcales bacterium]